MTVPEPLVRVDLFARLAFFFFLLATFSIFYWLNESHRVLFMYLLFFSLLPTALVHPGFLGAERAEHFDQSLVFLLTPMRYTYMPLLAPPTHVRAGGSPSLTLLRRLYKPLWRNPCIC